MISLAQAISIDWMLLWLLSLFLYFMTETKAEVTLTAVKKLMKEYCAFLFFYVKCILHFVYRVWIDKLCICWCVYNSFISDNHVVAEVHRHFLFLTNVSLAQIVFIFQFFHRLDTVVLDFTLGIKQCWNVIEPWAALFVMQQKKKKKVITFLTQLCFASSCSSSMIWRVIVASERFCDVVRLLSPDEQSQRKEPGGRQWRRRNESRSPWVILFLAFVCPAYQTSTSAHVCVCVCTTAKLSPGLFSSATFRHLLALYSCCWPLLTFLLQNVWC